MKIDNLLNKPNLTTDDISEIDTYFSDNIEEALLLSDEDIKKWITLIKSEFGFSLFENSLQTHISLETTFYEDCLTSEEVNQCLRFINLIKPLDFDCLNLHFALATHYLNFDKEKAIEIYKNVFENNFDIYSYGYYSHLVEYFQLLNINPAEKLIVMIANSPVKEKNLSIDVVNLYLLTIINLKKTDERYIEHIEKAIPIAMTLVEEYRQSAIDLTWSDSYEERNLCELIALKFEYFVNKRDYITAYELYKQLTVEIGKSDCTRYYHARDKFYYQMIDFMQEDYPELAILKDVRYKTLEILDKFDKVEDLENKEITLKDEDENKLKFVVLSAKTNGELIIAPLLPLLGKGGTIFTQLKKGAKTNQLIIN